MSKPETGWRQVFAASAPVCAPALTAPWRVALPGHWRRRAAPRQPPMRPRDTPVAPENAPTSTSLAYGSGCSRSSIAIRIDCELRQGSHEVCADSPRGEVRRRMHSLRPSTPRPVPDQCTAVNEKSWGLAVQCGTLLGSLFLAEKRLPQRARIFKFPEGDPHH